MQTEEEKQELTETEEAGGDAPAVYIDKLGEYEGKRVKVRGWLMHHRDQKKLQFIVLRDGTGSVQVVAFKGDFTPEEVGAIRGADARDFDDRNRYCAQGRPSAGWI